MENSVSYSPAIALWNQRQALANSRDRLEALSTSVNWLNDLMLYGWGQWFTTALEFAPDLIVELGRGHGNSTCVFTEAANQLGNCQVVSLCLSDIWHTSTMSGISETVPPEWFRPLDARMGNILDTDFKDLLEGKQRVLILWDAHGFEVAGFMLGYLLPLLRHHQHLVIMHDISDARYCGAEAMGYQNQGIWHGRSAHTERMVLGHFNSAVAQAISILDFTSRNQLTLHSSDHSFYTELSQDQINTLRQELGNDWFNQNGHWFWFSLNEKPLDSLVHFPIYSKENMEGSVERLEAEKQQLEAEKQQLEAEKQQLEAKKQQSEAEKQRLQNYCQANIEQLQNRIKAMESSKFWQMREAWLSVKQKMGLKPE